MRLLEGEVYLEVCRSKFQCLVTKKLQSKSMEAAKAMLKAHSSKAVISIGFGYRPQEPATEQGGTDL